MINKLHFKKAREESSRLREELDGRRSPAETMRAKCLDCNHTAHEVRWCPETSCPLWQWRFGKKPETVMRKEPEMINPDFVKAGLVALTAPLPLSNLSGSVTDEYAAREPLDSREECL